MDLCAGDPGRLGELAALDGEGGRALEPGEKAEQQALRAEYVAGFRKSLKSQLDNTVVLNPDGTSYKLRQKRKGS